MPQYLSRGFECQCCTGAIARWWIPVGNGVEWMVCDACHDEWRKAHGVDKEA